MSEPIGSEYGLEPLRPELYVFEKPPVTSRDLVSTEDYRDGSEFGGVGGLIQPAPHTPSASERLHMIYAIDPTDDGTEAGSVAPPELDGSFDPR
jgi:hypothetical protein